jgi:hypothetical protein
VPSDMHPLGLEPRTYSHGNAVANGQTPLLTQVSAGNRLAQRPNRPRTAAQRGDEGVTAHTSVLLTSGVAA